MKKLQIPLSEEWTGGMDGKRIHVFADRECIAIGEPDGKFYAKINRCNKCGKCCMNLPTSWFLGTKEIDGIICCKYLKKDVDGWLCSAGSKAPYTCNRDLINNPPHPNCVIRYSRIG